MTKTTAIWNQIAYCNSINISRRPDLSDHKYIKIPFNNIILQNNSLVAHRTTIEESKIIALNIEIPLVMITRTGITLDSYWIVVI